MFRARTYEIRRADGSLVREVPAPLATVEGLDGLVIYDIPEFPEVQDGDTITVRFTKSVLTHVEPKP